LPQREQLRGAETGDALNPGISEPETSHQHAQTVHRPRSI